MLISCSHFIVEELTFVHATVEVGFLMNELCELKLLKGMRGNCVVPICIENW